MVLWLFRLLCRALFRSYLYSPCIFLCVLDIVHFPICASVLFLLFSWNAAISPVCYCRANCLLVCWTACRYLFYSNSVSILLLLRSGGACVSQRVEVGTSVDAWRRAIEGEVEGCNEKYGYIESSMRCSTTLPWLHDACLVTRMLFVDLMTTFIYSMYRGGQASRALVRISSTIIWTWCFARFQKRRGWAFLNIQRYEIPLHFDVTISPALTCLTIRNPMDFINRTYGVNSMI